MRTLLVVIAMLFSGCLMAPAPQNADEWVRMTQALGGSGCVYIRGKATPYADVSMLTIATWGVNAPTYETCLKTIPDAARSLGTVMP